jgi:two-component system cell cycle sensor histidine kinase/response regulator CckA
MKTEGRTKMSLQPSTHSSPGGRFSRTYTILLVEDEPFVREATRSILASAGLDVLTAEDAAAALRIYNESHRPIDLVMTDMVLPGESGEQLGRDLCQRSPHLKVLVTSGYSNFDGAVDEPEARRYFLAKPYSRRDLVDKIDEIFRGLPLHRIAGQAG